MKNITALVVGGNGGIGSSVVKKMLDRGCDVVATYLKNENLIKDNARLNWYEMDLSNEVGVENIMKVIIKNHGNIDILVYAASSPIVNKPIFNLEWSDYKEHIDIQARGMFFIFKALKEQIKNRKKIKCQSQIEMSYFEPFRNVIPIGLIKLKNSFWQTDIKHHSDFIARVRTHSAVMFFCRFVKNCFLQG